MGEVLMNAKHVGFFSTGRGYDRFPSVDCTSERSFNCHPSEKIGRLRVYFATNPTGVMVFPVPEELTLK